MINAMTFFGKVIVLRVLLSGCWAVLNLLTALIIALLIANYLEYQLPPQLIEYWTDWDRVTALLDKYIAANLPALL